MKDLNETAGYNPESVEGVNHSIDQKMTKKEAIKKNLNRAIEMLNTGNMCEALLHTQEASQDLICLRCDCNADLVRNSGMESGVYSK